MNRLIFSRGDLIALRNELLSSSLETSAFVLAYPVTTPAGHRLLVRRILRVPPEAYEERTPHSIRISPTFVAFALKAARIESLSVVLIHTHPFKGDVVASEVDLRGESLLLPVLRRRVPNVPHCRLIFGRDGFDSALLGLSTQQPLVIQDAGSLLSILENSRNDISQDVFDRQIRAFGLEGQSRLATLSVGIVGLGGVGSIVAQQLAHLGVSYFTLIDPDLLETSNLNRVVGGRAVDVGRPKVNVAADVIRQTRPSSSVREIQADVLLSRTARELLDTDVVFCCTDSQGSRALLTQMAYQYFLPVFDMGVRIEVVESKVEQITGRVQMLAPGISCLVCQNLLDPEAVRRDFLSASQRAADPYIVGATVPQPAVMSLNGTVASLGVTMFLAAVAGIPLRSRHQVVRFESGVVRSIVSEPDPRCVICSNIGAFGRGDAWHLPGRLE
jgi:molybdopterin-synthase adenylyltransferase